jgi:hypothetical protein
MENFSRPVSRASFSHITPPKRISSLNACNPAVGVSEDALNANDNVHSSRIYPRRTSRAALNHASSPVGFHLPPQDKDDIAVGHAISTADDSARHLKVSPLPMLPVDLDDVPEDEEGFVHCESRESQVGHGSQMLPLRHVQSFPSSRHDTFQNDHLAKHQPCRDTKRFSIGLKPMCETQHWEDDVDYCYEHAAEAESDFDWDQQVVNFPVGLLSSVFDASDPIDQSLSQLHQLAGLSLHDRKHDSQESSVLSIASSIAEISRSTNSVGSLPELDYSVNSSRESMDWELSHGNKRHSKPTQRRSPPTSPAKSVKTRQGLGLSYSLFPSNTTPPRTP